MNIQNVVLKIQAEARNPKGDKKLMAAQAAWLLKHLESDPEIKLNVFRAMDQPTRKAVLYMFCALMVNAAKEPEPSTVPAPSDTPSPA